MSQSGLRATASGIGAVTTLTGDVGGAVGPNGAGNITLVGGNLIDTTGNPGGNSLTFDVVGGTNGQVIIGSTLGTPAFATITSSDASITFTPGANTLDMVVNSSGLITSVIGGDNINVSVVASVATVNLNETIHWPNTNAAGTTGAIYLGGAGGVGGNRFLHNMGVSSTFLGANAGNFTMFPFATANVGIGTNALMKLNFGGSNTAVGTAAGENIINSSNATMIGTSAGFAASNNSSMTAIGAESLYNSLSNWNTGCGFRSGYGITLGAENSAFGYLAMGSGAIQGQRNIAMGTETLIGITTGSYNLAFGYQAGMSLTGTDSSNVLINHPGVASDNNTIRIGTDGAGVGQQNRCFVAGIFNINPSLANERAVVIDSAGQLGTLTQTNGQLLIGSTAAAPVAATITAGAGITVANGAGSITISATGADLLTYTNVAVTPYAVLTTDEFLGVDCSGGIITVQLPNAPSTGRVFYIKDRTGNANINNITVTTVGGVVLIDGAATYTMNTQYAAISVLFDGSTFQVF